MYMGKYLYIGKRLTERFGELFQHAKINSCFPKNMFKQCKIDMYGRPANYHGLAVSLAGFYSFYSFYSLTVVVTVAHRFILAPQFYFHIDSCQYILHGTRSGSTCSA